MQRVRGNDASYKNEVYIYLLTKNLTLIMFKNDSLKT